MLECANNKKKVCTSKKADFKCYKATSSSHRFQLNFMLSSSFSLQSTGAGVDQDNGGDVGRLPSVHDNSPGVRSVPV